MKRLQYNNLYLLTIFLLVIFSCSTIRENSNGLSIKEKITVQKFPDRSLGEKSIIEGIVYSRMDSVFLEYANITIDRKSRIGTTSNQKGYFEKEIDPGNYLVECFYIGHNLAKTKEIKVQRGNRIFIIFELGTDIIY
jgi:hypothetical protein